MTTNERTHVTDTTTTTADRQMFHDWLQTHARGLLDQEATAALSELVEAVSHLEKKGTLTLEVTVEPAGSGGRTVLLAGVVKTKPPTPAPEASIRYVGDGGTLHLDDPYAQRIPGVPYRDTDGDIRVVDETTGEVRSLDDEE